MPTVEVFALCGAAEIRHGLLSILSAGITRTSSQTLPIYPQVDLATMILVPPDEIGSVIELRVVIKRVDTAEVVAQSMSGFQAQSNTALPGEPLHVPLIVPLRQMPLPAAGGYDIQLLIDGQPAADLTFWAVLGDLPQP